VHHFVQAKDALRHGQGGPGGEQPQGQGYDWGREVAEGFQIDDGNLTSSIQF
jgi:hypothetical protein